jgi:hypothetical protein
MEAEKTRNTINGAVNSLKKFMEDVGETSRRLGASAASFYSTHKFVLLN